MSAKKKNRQTFEKLKREQEVKEKRLRKQEARRDARAARLAGEVPATNVVVPDA
jgi:hypothetical protein